MRQVLHISQREWKSHIKHDCKLDDLGAVLKERKDTGLGMSQKLIFTMLSDKVVYSDKAKRSNQTP